MAITTETLPLTVNFDLTVEEMVEAGHYDCVDEDITSTNFPTAHVGEWQGEAIIVDFRSWVGSIHALSSEQIFAELDKMDLRAGELHELLALGAQHPDKQCENSILALGSILQLSHGRAVPILSVLIGRELYVTWYGGWDKYDVFLAFRK